MIVSRRGTRVSFHVLIALTAAAALAVTGCTFPSHGGEPSGRSASTSAASPVKKLKVSRPYTGTVTGLPGGTFTPSPDGNSVTIQDRPFNGTLSASLPKKVRVQKKPGSEKTFKLKALNGTYATLVDGTSHSSGTGQYTGLQLVKFNKRPLGLGCISFNTTTTNNEQSESGTFALIGGTRALKRARFAGTINQTGTPSQGNTTPVSGVIAGKIKFNKKKRPLNSECRALLPSLP